MAEAETFVLEALALHLFSDFTGINLFSFGQVVHSFYCFFFGVTVLPLLVVV